MQKQILVIKGQGQKYLKIAGDMWLAVSTTGAGEEKRYSAEA